MKSAAASAGRASTALSTMQHNRELLLQVYAPHPRPGRFPRSATIRWIAAHLSGKAVLSTLVSAAVLRPTWMRLAMALWSARRRRR